jgi:perosamine synthetase
MIRLAEPDFGPEECAAVEAVLKSGWLVQGTQVASFEHAVASTVGTREAVAVNSGTTALILSLQALGIGAGDEVITAALTYPATANAIESVGARPVFVDVSLDDCNIDCTSLGARVTPRTRAILPVHLFGAMADLEAVLTVVEACGAVVLEDAACALGAERRVRGEWRRAGAVGAAGCFSFHPRKNVTTGEGGMITTDTPETAERLRRLRNHGSTSRDGRWEFPGVGGNYRLTEMQGALGVVQMGRLAALTARRRVLVQRYNAALARLDWLRIPQLPEGSRSVFQSYVVVLDTTIDRARVIAALRRCGIETAIPTYAVPLTTYYRNKYGYGPGDFPVAERVCAHGLSLPLHPRMSDEDIGRVAGALRETVA